MPLLRLHVPAQGSLLQSADDAVSGRVPGPHVACESVSQLLLHATWGVRLRACVMAEHSGSTQQWPAC